LIRVLFAPILHNPSPYLLGGVAVLAAAGWGGWGPGLFATGVSALAGWYFYVAPRLASQPPGPADSAQLISFLLVASVATFLADRLRSARRSAELAAAH